MYVLTNSTALPYRYFLADPASEDDRKLMSVMSKNDGKVMSVKSTELCLKYGYYEEALQKLYYLIDQGYIHRYHKVITLEEAEVLVIMDL